MGNKRAVSEVVGALLMIALAVTAGVVVYVYSSGLLGSLQGSKVHQPYLEKVTLDYYQWNMVGSTNGTVTLKVRNTGSTQITLADFFIAGNPVITSYGPGCPGGVVTVNSPPPFCSVTLTYSNASFTQGVSYNIRVVTNDGAIFDFACIAGTTS